MPVLLIRHRVADYATWKRWYRDRRDTRIANGAQEERIFRNANAPNELLILIEWDNLYRARLYAQSGEMGELIVQASVTDEPDLWFLNEIVQPLD